MYLFRYIYVYMCLNLFASSGEHPLWFAFIKQKNKITFNSIINFNIIFNIVSYFNIDLLFMMYKWKPCCAHATIFFVRIYIFLISTPKLSFQLNWIEWPPSWTESCFFFCRMNQMDVVPLFVPPGLFIQKGSLILNLTSTSS